jgi:hypothetical protein
VREKTVIAQGDTQASRDHVERKEAPKDPIQVILDEIKRSSNNANESNDEEKRGVHPVNPVKRNSKIHNELGIKKRESLQKSESLEETKTPRLLSSPSPGAS